MAVNAEACTSHAGVVDVALGRPPEHFHPPPPCRRNLLPPVPPPPHLPTPLRTLLRAPSSGFRTAVTEGANLACLIGANTSPEKPVARKLHRHLHEGVWAEPPALDRLGPERPVLPDVDVLPIYHGQKCITSLRFHPCERRVPSQSITDLLPKDDLDPTLRYISDLARRCSLTSLLVPHLHDGVGIADDGHAVHHAVRTGGERVRKGPRSICSRCSLMSHLCSPSSPAFPLSVTTSWTGLSKYLFFA